MNPLALVSTATPPIWAVFSAVPDEDEAGPDADADVDVDVDVDGVPPALGELLELLHAPASRTAPASAAPASHLLLMAYLPSEVGGSYPSGKIPRLPRHPAG